MNRPALRALAVGAMAASALGLATRDGRHYEPRKADVEAIAGVPLGAPSFYSASPLNRLRMEARASWAYVASPFPNTVFFWPDGDAWTYPFAAPAGYRPPGTSPLACTPGPSGGLGCIGEGLDGWAYWLSVEAGTEQGTLTAIRPRRGLRRPRG